MRILFESKLGPVTIDESDSELISPYNWSVAPGGYVRAHIPGSRPPKKIYLSQLLLPCLSGFVIDHIDRNPLNNCRSNLRICTQGENARNKAGRLSDTGYIGVNRDRRQNGEVFHAAVTYKRKKYYLGSFTNAEAAARARDEKAKELHGEYAILNFPKEGK